MSEEKEQEKRRLKMKENLTSEEMINKYLETNKVTKCRTIKPKGQSEVVYSNKTKVRLSNVLKVNVKKKSKSRRKKKRSSK